MKARNRIKRANDARIRRTRVLLAKIATRNDTGLDDGVVLAILRANNGPWTEYASVEEMLASLDIEE